MKKTTAIILAAGRGKRLGSITRDTSKVLLRVGNKTLIEYAVDFVKGVGIKDIIVVAGYCFDQVKKSVTSIDSSVKIINNQEYKFQNLLSFAKALEQIENGGVFTYDADHIFSKENLEKTEANLKGISIYCSYDLSGSDKDVMKIKVDEQVNVTEMSKYLKDFECIYTGMFFVEDKHIPVLKKIVSDLLARYGKEKTRVEAIFKAFIEKGFPVKVINVGKANWFEVDTSQDLELARRHYGQNAV